MDDLNKELEAKTVRLRELVNARSKGYCSSVHSSADEVKRETEIDELEQQIKLIEEKLGTKKRK